MNSYLTKDKKKKIKLNLMLGTKHAQNFRLINDIRKVYLQLLRNLQAKHLLTKHKIQVLGLIREDQLLRLCKAQ